MATSCGEDEEQSHLLQEFEKWQENTGSDEIFLLEAGRNDSGSLVISMLLGSEHEFKVLCPKGYPLHTDCFYVETTPVMALWCNALNEYLLSLTERCSFKQLLDKGASLHSSSSACKSSDDEQEVDMSDEDVEEEDDTEMVAMSDDDSAFTTDWELKIARRKKLWVQKEAEIRQQMKQTCVTCAEFGAIQVSGQEKKQAKQIFTSDAASGILTNDLVRIMESDEDFGFSAEPIDNNIYQWSVRLYQFEEESDLHRDLIEINEKFGYSYIELQLDFTIDLYPFYPPLVKVIRPRLQGSMMQRVTNMEILKLSYWNPAKDMKGVLHDIKVFLQQWARLEVSSERNDPKRYPAGSYVEIEHHLLRLSLVSEVNPRVNLQFHLDPSEVRQAPAVVNRPSGEGDDPRNHEYWAPGTGYGHEKRSGWDVKAYLAAQKEKDNQVETVLYKILHELKILYANHAPQLKPRNASGPTNTPLEVVDPVEDMFTILEGSSLIPFIEQYMKADSFLEICRHMSVYKAIIDIIRELALQPQLIRLLCMLPEQEESVFNLVKTMEQKATSLISRMSKSGNGAIPKPVKKKSKKDKELEQTCFPFASSSPEKSSSSSLAAAKQTAEEEKLARELVTLHKDITDIFKRDNIQNESFYSPKKSNNEQVEVPVLDKEKILEAKYKRVLQEIQFDCQDIDLDGSNAHHYSSQFNNMAVPSQSQVFRIAQEYTSLSSSLPLELSSSIFVRTDDDKLPLMKALITGPEGTPYTCGCYLFDIYFDEGYPTRPPRVNLQTTGGGSVRFNPNLYNCGKVCLSLLGTWEGKQGETWNETTSTILQVLVSIQSLILVADPYFNEPGYEQEIGTEPGKKHSADYSLDVMINNIKYAVNAQITNPSPGFEDVIHAHFYLKKDRLIEEAEGWLRRNKSPKLERVVQNMKTELRKLRPPPNLANLFQEDVVESQV